MDDELNKTVKETFQEPRKRFWLRSRKRPKSDVMNESCLDISIDGDFEKKKKRRRITEVANLFSTNNNKLGNTPDRSFSFEQKLFNFSFSECDSKVKSPRKRMKCDPETTNILTLRSWLFDVADISIKNNLSKLTKNDIKRQEAIYELYCGESVLVDNLTFLKDNYYIPLKSNGILSSEELEIMFGKIEDFIEIHNKLKDDLISSRNSSGITDIIGDTILVALSNMKDLYLERSKTLVWARHLINEKKFRCRRFQMFLKKQLELPQAIDLWSHLDAPRYRIVKYPILIKEILKYTSLDHADQLILKTAYDSITELLKDMDKLMGEADCKLAQSKILVKHEYDPENCIANATELIAEGPLKDKRGVKYHCFLFNTCFSITQSVKRTKKKYMLSMNVISKDQIIRKELEGENVNLGLKIGNNLLFCEDEHGKKHWVESIKRFSLSSKKIFISNSNEKENKPALLKTSQYKRKSLDSVTVKKNLKRPKRNSFGVL